MDYKVLLKQKVKVYGDSFHVELREYRPDYFQLVNVYSGCEHDWGVPYETLDAAIRGFEAACGVKVSEDMRNYLGER